MQIIDSSKTIASSSKSFFLGTMFSRISGLFRDMSLAFFFGNSASFASFLVAFRLANLFRRVFGEGILSSSFIPFFESEKIKSQKNAYLFYRDLLVSLAFLLGLIVVFLSACIFVSLHFIKNEQVGQILTLCSIMLPGLIFICLYALNTAFLQSEKIYFLPSIAPLVFNLVWIISAYLFKDAVDKVAMIAMSLGICVAFFMQFLLTMQKSMFLLLKKVSIKDLIKPKLFNSDLKKLIKPISLSIIGVCAVQINSALDSIFAKIADSSGPAYLWYAIRMEQLPIALFAIATSSALLPALTRAFQDNDMNKFRLFFNKSYEKNFVLMNVCFFGIFSLGVISINLLYGRGDFDNSCAINTLFCLWAYAPSLIFVGSILIFSQYFYCQKIYLYPVIASVCSVSCNVCLNAFFVFFCNWGAISIALATSISACFNCLLLLGFIIRHKKMRLFEKKSQYFKIVIVMFMASVSTIFLTNYIFQDPTKGIIFQNIVQLSLMKNSIALLQNFFVATSCYFLLIFFFAKLFKINAVFEIAKQYLLKIKID
jgi:putative peptidoglycan lipid II flippase